MRTCNVWTGKSHLLVEGERVCKCPSCSEPRRLCPHSLRGSFSQALVGNHQTANGEIKAQRRGHESGPQGHTRWVYSRGRTTPELLTPPHILGESGQEDGFLPLVSLLIQTRLFRRLLLVPTLLSWLGTYPVLWSSVPGGRGRNSVAFWFFQPVELDFLAL